jgi:RTC4-like domain
VSIMLRFIASHPLFSYGEQGSVIIHQTLFNMFPPASFDPARISPLTSNEFVLRILVPEVALRLIMEDRDQEGNDEMHQALVVLRESSAYGVAMFPEDGVEGSTGQKRRDDVMGVGDKIVMERARKRRKELEEEEQEEREAATRIAEMEQVKLNNEKMGGRKRKGKQREQQLEEQQVPVERSRPRPRPIVKASSSMSIQPPSDHEEPPQPLQPSVQHESLAMRRSSRKNAIERSNPKMDVDLYDADEDDVDWEIENVLDIKTPVGKYGPSYRATNDTSDEETPKLKPLVLPRTGELNNIKPLTIARMRQSQKNDSE